MYSSQVDDPVIYINLIDTVECLYTLRQHVIQLNCIYIWSRPINISQRASLATSTAMTRCEMVQQSPHLLTRCSDAPTKVLATDMETALDMARLKSLTPLEEKMVRWDQVRGWFWLAMTSVKMGMRSMRCTVVGSFFACCDYVVVVIFQIRAYLA